MGPQRAEPQKPAQGGVQDTSRGGEDKCPLRHQEGGGGGAGGGLLLRGTEETFESGHYGEWASYGSAHDRDFLSSIKLPVCSERSAWLSPWLRGCPGGTESKKSGGVTIPAREGAVMALRSLSRRGREEAGGGAQKQGENRGLGCFQP